MHHHKELPPQEQYSHNNNNNMHHQILKYNPALKINADHIPVVHAEKCANDYLINTRQRLRSGRWFDKSWRDSTGYWQQHVNDKYGSTLFAQSLGIKAPRVLWCGDYSGLKEAVGSIDFDKGYVIKPKNGHSSMGVNVFPNGIKLQGSAKETLRDGSISLDDLLVEYEHLVKIEGKQYSELYIEEIVRRKPGELIDYKFLMFGSEVGAIQVYANRGTAGYCKSTFDKEWNRVDENGCFGTERKQEHKYGITAICGIVERPTFHEELERAAKVLGAGLGVFMRIDFMVDHVTGDVFLGEVSPWPDGGSSHCYSVGGDSCHLSRMWKGLEGGPGSDKPEWVEEFEEEQDKCKFVMDHN